MNLFTVSQIILLLSPAVICVQRFRKSTNPNDEPFLPIHPEFPYNPKLIKRGLEQQQQQQQPQPQTLTPLSPEIYAPKVDARDSYSASFNQNPYYPSYDAYTKTATSPNSLTTSPYYQTSYSTYNANPYNLLNSYSSPYSSTPSTYGSNTPNFGTSPYPSPSGPYPYYLNQPPYYYPHYYYQPPYPPPPPGYPSGPSKHQNDDEDDEEDEKRREKSKKSNNQKNRLRSSDRDSANNQFVDGANYIISSTKDLDGESSTHRTPSQYNQIDQDSDVPPRTVVLPKTYRLVSISGQPPADYNSGHGSYVKIQQLEQMMRQALAKLLAQNAAQQANLAQIQQEASQHQNAKDNNQYIAVPTAISKTGLSYVVNPTILNRVNTGQYNPSSLIQTDTIANNKQTYAQKPTTSVSLQQSHGVYIPPGQKASDLSPQSDYGDYDSPDSVTARSHNSGGYQATSDPIRNNYAYSTYRPTQQTNLEDVNFGNKQKNKS